MPWFKVDDHFHSHPKILATTPAALGLWVVAGSWAAANPDDGFVPAHVLPRLLPGWEPLAEELVERRLWQRTKGGYKFRNWAEFQPSKAEIEDKRKRDAERQRNRRARMNGQVSTPTVTQLSQRESRRDTSVSHATPTRPDPTRPIQENSTSSLGAHRGSRLTDDWQPTPDDIAWAKTEHPGIDGRLETEKFRNHWMSKSGKDATKLDWSRTWRNWIINAQSFNPTRPTAPAYKRTPGREGW